jgi:hypothetical protein
MSGGWRDSDRHSATDSVEKLLTFQRNPKNGSVSAEFCSFACGYHTLVADFSNITLSRQVFQQNRRQKIKCREHRRDQREGSHLYLASSDRKYPR